MNKPINILIGFMMLVSLCACSNISTYPIYNKDSIPQETEITPLFEVPEDWNIISFDEASEHYNDPKTVMVYSFEDCPHCAVVIPLLDEIHKTSLDNGNILATHIGDEGVNGKNIKETLESYMNLLINA